MLFNLAIFWQIFDKKMSLENHPDGSHENGITRAFISHVSYAYLQHFNFCHFSFSQCLFSYIFSPRRIPRERCKGVHCVDLGESFPTSIFLQNLASIQPRTSGYVSNVTVVIYLFVPLRYLQFLKIVRFTSQPASREDTFKVR